MAMLTPDQVTEVTDALEALRDDLRTRRWSGARITSVMTSAAGSLVSIAAMRSPVPQAAYFQPSPYSYGPEDCGQPPYVTALTITVTGGSRQELEDRARAEGQQVFGADADLSVRLSGSIARAGHSRGGETQYTCGAEIRERGCTG